ncbi:hypothetical protein A3A76_03905 [Candidatus Woesebacteria bacterium RIFCSPLOWO2_01_FULL_39_23]|uniref:Glycosyltransferase RgtA/B/C/D-like domain-containing protein n=1 Tax=Candidatus Woesebacteria bacterium RIFCSPHIGHO2_01_FULL_40_22 TaxID=1802499 RepID=A0A1F7YLX6_9BACT|nr:MAG: hypothetical protein A2628_02305 [Candidatus Woesebacteria bacterium RIFCSPHIGHO2_01_FULL_40_22]OGM36751.1 MAG: hypothetical protein A3E41_03155 [Candidatus Woesebacteria bacterium RIFCSPHIGHO2_12_FULL_38_9]OGM62772.1 MAG: hypothetical protein A3A76_03905 [Candidatus Woesebacteria bacterium RIFCSPLOWO2_01_FULL_39_23]
MKKLLQRLELRDFFLIILGSVAWSLTMVKSGLCWGGGCSNGLGFWGPNGHDGIWHIALAGSLARGSWQMPMFAGEIIKNYHLGFDLILAALHKITFIPIVNLYFQILPPIFALVIGVGVYLFVYEWRKSRYQAFWATFFTYFAGSLGWLVTYLRHRQFEGESMFWSQQSISTLVNPPFALSLIFIFIGLTILLKGVENRSKKYLMLATFFFGSLIQVKVYAGILILGALFVASMWYVLTKNSLLLLKVFAGVLILSILLFSPINGSSQNAIIWKPFWFLETMMSDLSRFYWPRFAEALINYKLGGVWLKGAIAYLAAFILFLVGNLGLRIFGFLWLARNGFNPKNYQYVDVFLLTIIFLGIIIPMLFIQSGTSWNTIQFFYYAQVLLGILAGITIGKWQEKSSPFVRCLVVITIFTFTIPTLIATLRNYLPARPPAKVSREELEALDFLSQQQDGVVLTQFFNKKLADAANNNPPRPLYLYESTAYVSAFSGKVTYLEDEVNLEITGYPWQTRQTEVERFFTDVTYDSMNELLAKKNINYIYVIKSVQRKYNDLRLDPNKIFENSEAIIYKY